MTEVRMCPVCGTRVNWEWMLATMQAGKWGRRCAKEACQYLDCWLPAEPDPPKDKPAVSNMKYYTENPGELERVQAKQAAEEADAPAWKSSLT